MNGKDTLVGHALAVFAIFVWGTTFVSTKILLVDFSPYEIIAYRIFLAYFTLLLIKPRILKYQGIKKELLYFLAGISGASVYQVLENLALDCAYASTTSVIIAAAPMFSAVFASWFYKDEKLNWRFFIGFVISMAGICLVSLNGSEVGFSLRGTLLALIAASLWGVYSVVCRKMGSEDADLTLVTRRTFFYAGLSMIPMWFIFDCRIDFGRFLEFTNWFNMVYLGIVASALCFFAWNVSVKKIGIIKSGIYIYVIPVITVIFSAIILKEKISLKIVLGTFLVLTGLLVSSGLKNKEKEAGYE